ncbi:MAG: LAGLIDADG homing endonuclease [Parcubacteria group bacterium GW2011_GWA2_47_8]|nr:MAG: LAGLIDADG homing endonuclease [Parcubacteria group bacterium GW2011_GWA2_47_8]OHB18260.1 MAG: hypothetical protein A2666_00635 [Parcubacteria group bacterium RIFCSPHIGHO2_01_FULL_47_10b]
MAQKSVTTIPTDLQYQIILGAILGDGSLEFGGYIGTRLQLKQREQNKEYISWLFKMLCNLCRSEPKQKRDTSQWYFSTRSLRELTKLHKLFYLNSKKVIPSTIGNMLQTGLSLAVWYMDDGTLDYRPKNHTAITLSTDSFPVDGVKKLQQVLERNFGIVSSIHLSLCRGKRYPKLYIGAKSRDNFLSLVRPHIVNCFRYKLPPQMSQPFRD